MDKTTVSVNIELKTKDLALADIIMKKMIKALNYEELDIIGDARVSKTISEVEMSSNIFEEEDKDGTNKSG